MKTLFYFLSLTTLMSLTTSCGSSETVNTAADSLSVTVDTMPMDTVRVDSIAVDSVK